MDFGRELRFTWRIRLICHVTAR